MGPDYLERDAVLQSSENLGRCLFSLLCFPEEKSIDSESYLKPILLQASYMVKMVFKYVYPIGRLSNEMLSRGISDFTNFVLILVCSDEKSGG